jgi:hypothetical protein
MIGTAQRDAARHFQAFFAREIEREEATGFARLRRVPDETVDRRLALVNRLSPHERREYLDCCAAVAAFWHSRLYGFTSTFPDAHPAARLWKEASTSFSARRNVRLLSAIDRQATLDEHAGRPPTGYSADDVEFARAIRPIRAAELQKRATAICRKLGTVRKRPGGNLAIDLTDGNQTCVHIDTGGATQFRYHIAADPSPLATATNFERTLGMGRGDWTFIVAENVDDVFLLFEDLLRHAIAVPARLAQWMA